MISGRRIGEKIGRVEARTVPEFVQIAMKPIGAGFGDVVHLRGSVSSLIDRVRERIHGYLGDGVEAQNEVGGQPAIQIGQRIVGFQAINDITIRK